MALNKSQQTPRHAKQAATSRFFAAIVGAVDFSR